MTVTVEIYVEPAWRTISHLIDTINIGTGFNKSGTAGESNEAKKDQERVSWTGAQGMCWRMASLPGKAPPAAPSRQW